MHMRDIEYIVILADENGDVDVWSVKYLFFCFILVIFRYSMLSMNCFGIICDWNLKTFNISNIFYSFTERWNKKSCRRASWFTGSWGKHEYN